MTIAFVFPGQGSQIVGMGREFYDNFSAARLVFEEVDEALNQRLSKIIFEGSQEDLTLTANAQPALMAVSIAMMRTLSSEIGRPISAIVSHAAGHSLGEYTAHCAAGTFSLSDTAKLLRLRGQAMQEAVPVGQGLMAAILGLETSDVEVIAAKAAQNDVCVIANDNSPGQIVISGHKAAVERAMAFAIETGAKRALPLAVSAPFHSPLMQPAAEKMAEAIANTVASKPEIPIIANVTTEALQDLDSLKSLLIEQVTARVRWRESMAKAASYGISQIVEIGAGKVLTGLIKRIDDTITAKTINTPDEMHTFLKTL